MLEKSVSVWPTCAFTTAKQRIYHPNCILFTHKFRHLFIITIKFIFSHLYLSAHAVFFPQNDCWRHISTMSRESELDAYSSAYIVGDISPTILIW